VLSSSRSIWNIASYAEPGSPVKRLIRRSVTAPTRRPAATSLAQCANSTTLVKTSPAPIAHSILRCREGRTRAADASAPICTAWPTERRQAFCRRGALRANAPQPLTGQASPDRTSSSGCAAKRMRQVIIRMWLLVRRDAGSLGREYSHHPAAIAHRRCSSAPHVRSPAACSVRGPVWFAIALAISTSPRVGRTVTSAMITSPTRLGLLGSISPNVTASRCVLSPSLTGAGHP
jgi:hypothetical protein